MVRFAVYAGWIRNPSRNTADHMNIKKIEPVNISQEQEIWSKTPEGILRTMLWEIESGRFDPERLIVISYEKTEDMKEMLHINHTDHNKIELLGLIEIVKQWHGERILCEG